MRFKICGANHRDEAKRNRDDHFRFVYKIGILCEVLKVQKSRQKSIANIMILLYSK